MHTAPREELRPGLTARGVAKSCGRTAVLRGLNLTIEAGDKILLLGANGAGKSTVLRLLSGLTRPDNGAIEFHSPRRVVGHVGHHLFLYRRLSVIENLNLTAQLARCGSVEVDAMVERWRLGNAAERPVGELSRGQQFRVSLARAFLPAPNFMFLDEPTSALDDLSVETLKELIDERLKAGDGGAAVIATHDTARLRSWVNRVVVLSEGVVGRDSRGSSIDDALEFYREVNR